MQGSYVNLRGLKESDRQKLEAWNFDSQTAHFFPARWPNSEHQQEAWFQAQSVATTKRKLMICDLESGEVVGLLGVLAIDQENKNCEIGITIGESKFRGRPHASEAVDLVLEFLFREQNFHVVYARIMEGNDRAVSFFVKKGFLQTGVLKGMLFRRGEYRDWLWLCILQSQWASTKGDGIAAPSP